ncbi:MAG: hypothetical protein H7A55_05025 [Verrucomicrobiaceae bacterium]|nr:hypothetical protein [Verrucomicrobiaceae bacterium]
MPTTFSPEDIATAQRLADNWWRLGIILFAGGFLAAAAGGWLGWSFTRCWLVLTVGWFGASAIGDFVIVLHLESFRHGITAFVKGDIGEAPAIGTLFAPISALIFVFIPRSLGRLGAYLYRRFAGPDSLAPTSSH